MERSYEAPATVEAAVELLQKHGAAARPLAGGTDLLVQMRSGAISPRVLVDVKRIPELTRVEIGAEEVVIGAACSTASLREEPRLAEMFPGLVEAAELIGSEQIQGRASIGGNLCNASPAADTVPALLVNDAVCEIAGPDGWDRVSVGAFCMGPGKTALQAGEFLAALRLPVPAPRCADAYLRLIPRTEMDIAVVGAAARVRLDDAGNFSDVCVALGAVAARAIEVPEVVQALLGEAPGEAAFERAAEAASRAADPIDDKRGSAAYRRRVAGVLTRRALAIASERAAAQN